MMVKTSYLFSNFLFSGPLTFLKITDEPKELLFIWVTSTGIYQRKLSQKNIYQKAYKLIVEDMSLQYSNSLERLEFVIGNKQHSLP